MLKSLNNPGKLRWRARWMAACSLASLFGVAGTQAAASAADHVQPALAHAAAASPARSESVIVQFRKGVTEAQANRLVRSLGGHVTVNLPIIHGLGAVMSARSAAKLSHKHVVRVVTLNSKVKGQGLATNLATTYPATVSATLGWQYGYSGSGVGVAVIDSGVAGNLADFQDSQGSSRVVETAITNPGATAAGDPFGHGTMVAGIIAGNGNNLSSSDPNYGKYVGAAPDANLISIKAGDDAGNATVLDVIDGIQFAIQHKGDYNIRVLNLSVASADPSSYTTDPLDAAAESAWQNGIVVVAAAGNQGNTPGAVNYAPANDPYVITVGAVDEHNTASAYDDTAAPYSSVGTTQDGVNKPELYAPGSHLISVLAPNSAFTAMCPSCIVGGNYIQASGTSFAAPVVTGLVADLLQGNPTLTPNQVKGGLLRSARTLTTPSGSIKEARLSQSLWGQQPSANSGLIPSTLLDANGNMSGWSGTTFTPAPASLTAGWSRSSWSCATCTGPLGAVVDPTRSSWSRSSWSRSSWSVAWGF